jgi:hypothetical protein
MGAPDDVDLHLAKRREKIEKTFDTQCDNIFSDGAMPAEAISALSALTQDGFTVLSGARREQTHLEFLVSEKNGGGLFELHTELDGRLRKLKPLHGRDPKWIMENR